MSIIINNIAYAPYVGDIEIGEAYLGDTLVYQKSGEEYTFSFYGHTGSSVNFGLNMGFQSGSTFVNVPFTLDGEKIYSGTTTNGTQHYTRNYIHNYDVSVKEKYGNQYTFYVNANTNVANLTSVTMSSTMPAVNLAFCFDGARNLTSIAGEGMNVTRMSYTFRNCINLTNIDGLANSNMSNVTEMSGTFWYCINLTNIDGLANSNISNVTSLYYTFYWCNRLTNIDGLANSNMSNVTNMYGTFQSCSNLTNIDALANWNTSSVTNMYGTFQSCSNLTNIDALANWNTSSVTNMYMTFYNCFNLTSITGINNWTGANANCTNFCQNTTNLGGNVAIQFNITCAANMFNGRSSAPMLNVYASTTTNAYNAIYRAMGNTTYNSSWQVTLKEFDPLYRFNIVATTANSTNIGMNIGFQNGSTFVNVPFTFNGEEIYSGTSSSEYYSNDATEHLFNAGVARNYGEQYTFYVNANTNVSEITTARFEGTMPKVNLAYCFNCATNLTSIESEEIAVTTLGVTFNNCRSLTNIDALANWNTSNVTNMAATFYNCRRLTNLDALANWNTSSLTFASQTFMYCRNVTSIKPLANWDTRNCGRLYAFFEYCDALTSLAGLENFQTGNVTNFQSLFGECMNVTNIDAVTNWNTSKVTDMVYTFGTCYYISNLNALANWSTGNVTTMRLMFQHGIRLTDISGVANWNMSSIVNTSNMFQNCYRLADLTPINNWTGANTNASSMFYNCTNVADNVAIQFNITNATNMFANRSSAPMLNVYASTTTNAYNAIYRAMGNTTYNSSWQVTLYELEQ